jgi:Holliday junction resolvase RusA-like endonuclease
MEYYKNSKQDWMDNKDKFLEMLKGKRKPYKIEFTFVRNSRRKFDYINPAQTVQDMMVKYGYLEDDNVTIMIPFFGKYSVDKEGAGVYIRVL